MKSNKTRILPGIFFLIFPVLLYSQEIINVKVFPEIYKQEIKSVGANFSQTRYTKSAWDDIGGETLKQFRPAYVRVALPLLIRGVDYREYKGELLTKQPLAISLFEELKRMKNEFGVKSISLSVWDVPNELVKDSSKRNQRVIKPEAYDEVLDMIVACLLTARNEYGVEVDYFSFNESEGGWQIIFTPDETIAFIKKAKERFKAAGLKTKFLLADTAQTKGTVEFATMIMADSSIWDMLGPLCFHSWWSENVPDSEFERVAAFAKAQNKPVWCTELGFDAQAHTRKGAFESWDYGFRLAKITQRMLKYAESEASMYWTWQNDYPIMSTDLKTMYPSYYVTKHLADFLNSGTQIVHSISSDRDLMVVSGIHKDGSKILQLVNTKNIPVSLEIIGFEAKSIDMITTTEYENWSVKENSGKSKDGMILVNLLPMSVNSLILK